MREARGRTGLLHEAIPERAVIGQMPVHDLDRHAALEAQIGGQVNRGHAAAGDS
jgi:hypothetical protein